VNCSATRHETLAQDSSTDAATDYQRSIEAHFRRNFVVNVADMAFWSLGSACASTATVLPLYLRHLTSNAVLIGLLPSLQFFGWRLPQAFTGNYVQRLPRKKPFVLLISLNERIPFLFLGLTTLLLASISDDVALALVFFFLAWQALGGGLAATAWQELIAKIILPTHWGQFFGLSSALGAVLGLGGAALTGYLLSRYPYPQGFAYSFLAAGFFTLFSWAALCLVVEPSDPSPSPPVSFRQYLRQLPGIIKADVDFRNYLLVRSFGIFAGMGSAFLAVYAVDAYNLTDEAAALFTSIMLISQALLNPILGRLGDKRSHKMVLTIAFTAQTLSMVIAATAPTAPVYMAAFSLKAVADAAYMSSGMPLVFEFAVDKVRPTYIGLANTLTAPPLVIAPLVGGAIATAGGYTAAFWASCICGLATLLAWATLVKDPRAKRSVKSTGQASTERSSQINT